MKIFFFVPPGGYFAERWSHGTMMPALGLLYMAALLEKVGHEVQVIPSHVLELTWKEIFKKIESEKPDIVGITTTTENRHLSFELARVAKRAHPGAFVALGGPHCKSTAQDILAHIPEADGVVSGEGEETMVDLAQAVGARGGFDKVLGLSFRKENGEIVHNAKRMLLRDLNELPMPARHLEPIEKYNFVMDIPGRGKLPAANLMTSRGCPFTCTFCATPSNWGTKVRALTPQNVVKEIEHCMERYGARAIWFYDDTFNFNRKRTAEICDLMIERKLNLSWYCEVRVDIMTKELTAKMAEAGLFYAGFGIESGSERICRDIITKKATLKQAYDFISWCNEYGVIANPFFIFSHPTETWEEAQETMRVFEDVKDRCDVSASILHMYPGTPLEARAIQEGKLPKDFTWTRKHDNRVILLPAAQGHAPLYVDKLSWWRISELMFRFAYAHKKINLVKKIRPVLMSLRSFGDVKRYAIMLLVYMKQRIQLFLDQRVAPKQVRRISKKVAA